MKSEQAKVGGVKRDLLRYATRAFSNILTLFSSSRTIPYY